MTYQQTEALVCELKGVVDTLFESQQDDLAERILHVCREITGKTIMAALPPSHVLFDLLLLLKDQGIRYAIIGGLAVNVHGQPRGTQDIDILVDRLPEHTTDVEYMRRFGFYRGKSSTGTVLTLDSRTGATYVEMLLANNPLFTWALRQAGAVDVIGVAKAAMVSREAFVALKVRALVADPKRREKDLPDIISVLVRGDINERAFVKMLSPEELDELTAILSAHRRGR
jgi:hypothetical protein